MPSENLVFKQEQDNGLWKRANPWLRWNESNRDHVQSCYVHFIVQVIPPWNSSPITVHASDHFQLFLVCFHPTSARFLGEISSSNIGTAVALMSCSCRNCSRSRTTRLSRTGCSATWRAWQEILILNEAEHYVHFYFAKQMQQSKELCAFMYNHL